MAGNITIKTGLDKGVALIVTVILVSCATPSSWQIYAFGDGTFTTLPDNHRAFVSPTVISTSRLPDTPPDWQVTASARADVTGDGAVEWVLLVWRPWRDWPIQAWVSAPSPISTFRDARGDSCHLILLDPVDGRERWAGSALPAPLLALVVGDVDNDGLNEVITLEGDYGAGRNGVASHVDVWAWNDFGFSLEWRSQNGAFRELTLAGVDGEEMPLIAVR